MRYRVLGESGIRASVVGLGAWAIGGWAWGGTDEKDAIAAIRAALDAGMTLIDTAPAYGFGLSEEIVGKALAGRRGEAVLATKCGLVWDCAKGERFFSAEGRDVHRYLGPDSIRREVEASLRRLKTDRIDLYQTHWQDATTPVAETMACLLDLKKEGKIRAIGVSNATTAHLDAYRAVGPVDADQELYSMLDRKAEEELIPYCRGRNIAVLAYSPLAQGLLTGAIGPDRVFPKGDHRASKPRFSVENRRRILAFLDEIRPMADRRGLTLGQLVTAWTIEQPGMTHALCGARTAAQAAENARAGAVELTPAEVAEVTGVLERRGAFL